MHDTVPKHYYCPECMRKMTLKITKEKFSDRKRTTLKFNCTNCRNKKTYRCY